MVENFLEAQIFFLPARTIFPNRDYFFTVEIVLFYSREFFCSREFFSQSRIFL